MTPELWAAVDRYITGELLPPDPALDAALKASAEAGLPAINVAPNQGKLLMLLAQLQGAKAILEIGTLGGYSTIWLARGLAPGGRLVTLESNPRHAQVARSNLSHAGLDVEVIVGPALESLPRLKGPFDLFFIDADKANNVEYFDWALKLSRPGSLIIVDNVVRDGRVIDGASGDATLGFALSIHETSTAGSLIAFTSDVRTPSGSSPGSTRQLIVARAVCGSALSACPPSSRVATHVVRMRAL